MSPRPATPGTKSNGEPGPEQPHGAALLDEEALRRDLDGLERVARRCSAVRLTSFLVLCLGLLGAAEALWIPWVVGGGALLVFAVAFVLHGRTLDRRRQLEDALTLLQEERRRRCERRRQRRAPRNHQETALGRGLRVYREEPETFAIDSTSRGLEEGLIGDLELLEGPRTLFGFLDWSSTTFGARRLLHMMLHPLRRAADLRYRQDAVEEIAAHAQVRQDLLAELIPARRYNLEPLTELFEEEPAFAGRKALQLWARTLGTATPLLLAALVLSGRLELVGPLILLVVFNLATIGKHSRASNDARDRLLLFSPFLETCLRLERVFETAPLETPAWKELVAVFANIDRHARRLKRYVDRLGFHSYGVLFEIVNAVTLWELRLLPAASDLLRANRERFRHAAGALGETEALLCLALPMAENGFVRPTILDEEQPVVEARALGHPLIEAAVAVRNPVALGRPDSIWIITGSNMSGKSTYLKSIGTNLVLAAMGGPVCADDFRWTPLAFYSDINVRDSLDDGKSYFRVEVERVLTVVRAAQKSAFVIAIFDELFRGTNSDERLAIARALLRHLRSLGALVLVATHDRLLANLVTVDSEPGMTNRHLRESVEAGVMSFDYRLRDGPAASRNAIRVLEAQGYPAAITEAAWREAPEREA